MNISTTIIMVLVFLLVLNIRASITRQSNQVPQVSHIVIGENTNADDLYGSSNAPYINSLADNGAKFINSHGLFHPSQLDYLALFSGSNQSATNDGLIFTPFTTPNLGRELIDAIKTYATYSEGLPSVDYNGNASGRYVRKHNPAANWMRIDLTLHPIRLIVDHFVGI